MRHVMEYEWDISWNHIPGVAEDEGFCSVPNHVLLLIIKKAYDHPQTQTLRIVHPIWRVLLPWRQTYGQMHGFDPITIYFLNHINGAAVLLSV